MIKKIGKKLITLLLAVMLVASLLPMNAFATSVTVLDGQVSLSDTSNNITVSNGTVTATAKGSLFSKTANTITITNETANQVELSFSYTASNYNSFTIANASVTATGTYTVVLQAGGTLTVYMQSKNGLSAGTATLNLSNFSLIAASDSSSVTVEYDSNLGSVTAGGEAISSGAVKEGVTLADGIALVATANSGTTFHGWINAANNQILSTANTYTLKPSADMTVKPVFTGANSAPHFAVGAATQKTQSSGLLGMSQLYYHTVGKSYIYDDLNAAANAAAADSSNKVLVLINDGTLQAGTYTIPSGVTLLIPFDAENSLYTSSVLSLEGDTSYVIPTAYRTLTMADGAKLVINGSVSLSAKQRAAQGSKRNGGSPTGPVSLIRMQGDSNITVNNGGNLYAYGFITGSGTVTANSGGTVHENFQFMDFRGGTQSTDMDNGVFPLSQYYIQNIEVPLTIYSGAKEYAYTTIVMSGSDFGSAVAFIGSSGCMFNLTSGYVVKTYDGSKDRLLVEVNGDISISSIEMSVGTSSINSKDYELPINSNLTVDVKSGNVNVSQDLLFLPGSEMIIRNGTNCKIGSGYSIYIYDQDEWGNYVFDADTKYSGPGNGPFVPLTYAPGRTYDRTTADLVDAMIQLDGTIDASAGYVYTTAGGANVFSTGTGKASVTAGTQTITHQLVQNTGYSEIPLTPVRFKNSDGTYITSATDTYTYTDGFWRCSEEKHVYTDTVTEPTCTEGGYTTHTCDICKHSYRDAETSPKGHSYDEEVITAPTCTENGESVFTCSVCGDNYSEIIAAEGHSYDDGVETAPTCTVDGYITFTCHCGDSYTEPSGKFATGHSYEEVVTAPTCTEEGYTTYTCACGDSYVGNYVAALGHSYGNWNVVTDAGCETVGSESRTCSVCNDVDTREIAAKGHDYEAVVTAPTCTEQGYTTYTCSNCKHSYVEDYVAALGHSMSDWIIDTNADCENAGSKHKKCANCDYTETETIPALGHSETAVVTEPTCTEQGYTTYTCTTCGAVRIDDYVDALGHDYEAVVTEPTCTEEGFTTYTCACGDSYVADTVEALGHSETAVVTEPTCTEKGYTTYTCTTCGTVRVDDYVDALGHDFGDWEIEIFATHSNEGKRVRKCACGEEENEIIPMIVCDTNADGAVNGSDLAEMKKLLINKITVTDDVKALMDMDDNGSVNILDMVKLKKYIAVNTPVAE